MKIWGEVMKITHERENDEIIVTLEGELGHHEARKAIDYLENVVDLYPTEKIILDLSRLTFMDSSGIAVVMNTYRNVRDTGRSLIVQSVPIFAMKIFDAAGITKIVRFTDKVSE